MNTILSRARQYPRWLYAILLIGLALRLAFILEHRRPLISDEKDYDGLAYSLATSGSYAVDGVPTAYRPVGYPIVVGLVYVLCGHQQLVVKCGQAILDTSTAFLIFLLLAGHPERTRLAGAALWACFPPAILYSNFLMSESVFTFLLALSFVLLTKDWDGKLRARIIIGAVLGLLVLMKPGFVLFLVPLPFFHKHLGIRLQSLMLIAVVFFAVLVPWMMRNYYLFGEISPSSNGGMNLLIGNNPNSTGAYGATFDPSIIDGARDEFDVDRRAFKYAVRYIAENPKSFILNAAKKFGRLFESEGGLLVWSFHSNPEDTASRYATKYASVPLTLKLVVNLPYFLLMLGGLFGFLGAQKDRFWWLASILLASWILLHIVFFGGGRFHFPLMPVMAVFATPFLAGPRVSFAQLSNLQRVVGITASLLFIALWTIEGLSVYSA